MGRFNCLRLIVNPLNKLNFFLLIFDHLDRFYYLWLVVNGLDIFDWFRYLLVLNRLLKLYRFNHFCGLYWLQFLHYLRLFDIFLQFLDLGHLDTFLVSW
jgi:hypothetical protein